MPYLKFCVKSVLESEHASVELLVSVDDGADGTIEFLEGIADPRLRVITTPNRLSMSEHWDFAQKHAGGDWQMFLGQDDMLMKGYVTSFDKLTEIARESKLEIIVGRRAYVTWPPLKDKRLKSLQHWGTSETEIKLSREFIGNALTTSISYHAGPQMYTTTLVHRDLINNIREANLGRLIMGHPQDAYLAASLLKARPNYLWSGTPFSWVGTSKRSAGFAIANAETTSDPEIRELANSYASSVADSALVAYSSQSDFRHGVTQRYFFDALKEVWPQILGDKAVYNDAIRRKMNQSIIRGWIADGRDYSAVMGVLEPGELKENYSILSKFIHLMLATKDRLFQMVVSFSRVLIIFGFPKVTLLEEICDSEQLYLEAKRIESS